MKQNAKICANGEQNVIIEVFILEEEREGMVEREKREDLERERERIEIERKETKGN